MSLLFKHLRIHQIFGANTDVGKTILTTALVRASASKNNEVYYLKPVSTGPIEDADDEHINRCLGSDQKDRVHSACLYRFQDPVSPHLAAQLARNSSSTEIPIPSDSTFVNAVASHIRRCASRGTHPAHMYVETAGGVHSPTLSGTTQLDSYRPLFLPTVLIGDSKLGGISSTISSYESLLLRGYMVDSILLFSDEYYRNSDYLVPYFAERGVHVLAVKAPPERHADPVEDLQLTQKYYEEIVPPSHKGSIFDTLAHLDTCHARRIAELDSFPRRSLDTIWWPFVQHGLVAGEADVTVIDSAHGDFFSVYNGRHLPAASTPVKAGSLLEPQFDSSASWWTQALGHAHPALTLAAAQRLVRDGPGRGWAARAFFSDDGATGMEVALKMALHAFAVRQGAGEDGKALAVLGLKGSYHGDTIGAMNACEEGVYTCEWHDAKGVWLDPPTVSGRNARVVVTLPPAIAQSAGLDTPEVSMGSLGRAYDVQERLMTPLAGIYRAYIERTLQKLQENGGPTFGAVVLEPLVLGAGGMVFVDPLFQRVLIDVVRGTDGSSTPRPASQWAGLPVIFDEVFVGLYRLGMESTGPLLGVHPDISVNAKILTGGLVPLAVTMASESIFQAFLSEKKTDALLHGHSYTAYPVGCEVANEALDVVEGLAGSGEWDNARRKWGAASNEESDGAPVWSFWNPEFVDVVSRLDGVEEVMTLGTLLAIKVKDEAGGYESHSAQKLLKSIRFAANSEDISCAPGGAPFGINYRTLGNVAYFMLSLNTPAATVRSIEDRLWHVLQQ
ncbi:onanonoxo-7-onima-8-eninoihtemlysoneda [Amylocystis lapponica]|nr:onanonoxo-7-onima-8-eninoihtemlysoneda [Amylocystis lapponica]